MTDQTQSYSQEEKRKAFEEMKKTFSAWWDSAFGRTIFKNFAEDRFDSDCWTAWQAALSSQAEQIKGLEEERDSALVRICAFDACIQQVAAALDGVCCGGVDNDQSNPHSTTTVLVEAIYKLQNERDNARDMLEALEQTPERIADKEFQHRALEYLHKSDEEKMAPIQAELAQSKETISALEARIAEADGQEPVGHLSEDGYFMAEQNNTPRYTNFYTRPPITSQRELELLEVIEQMRELLVSSLHKKDTVQFGEYADKVKTQLALIARPAD